MAFMNTNKLITGIMCFTSCTGFALFKHYYGSSISLWPSLPNIPSITDFFNSPFNVIALSDLVRFSLSINVLCVLSLSRNDSEDLASIERLKLAPIAMICCAITSALGFDMLLWHCPAKPSKFFNSNANLPKVGLFTRRVFHHAIYGSVTSCFSFVPSGRSTSTIVWQASERKSIRSLCCFWLSGIVIYHLVKER